MQGLLDILNTGIGVLTALVVLVAWLTRISFQTAQNTEEIARLRGREDDGSLGGGKGGDGGKGGRGGKGAGNGERGAPGEPGKPGTT